MQADSPHGVSVVNNRVLNESMFICHYSLGGQLFACKQDASIKMAIIRSDEISVGACASLRLKL